MSFFSDSTSVGKGALRRLLGGNGGVVADLSKSEIAHRTLMTSPNGLGYRHTVSALTALFGPMG